MDQNNCKDRYYASAENEYQCPIRAAERRSLSNDNIIDKYLVCDNKLDPWRSYTSPEEKKQGRATNIINRHSCADDDYLLFYHRHFEREKERSYKGESRRSMYRAYSRTSLPNYVPTGYFGTNHSSGRTRAPTPENEMTFRKVSKARKLIYKQYFKDVDSTPTSHNALKSKKSEKTNRSKKSSSKTCRSTKVTVGNEDGKFQRKKQRFKSKIGALKKKYAAISRQLLEAKEDHAETCRKLEVSRKRVCRLELQEHNLNLEYADLEDTHNCLIFPL